MKLASLFERKTLPTIPTEIKSSRKAGSAESVGISDYSDYSDSISIEASAKLEQGNFPQTRPKRCYLCDCWQNGGHCYWVGRCTITGARLDIKSRCTIGFIEPMPPRPPQRARV